MVKDFVHGMGSADVGDASLAELEKQVSDLSLTADDAQAVSVQGANAQGPAHGTGLDTKATGESKEASVGSATLDLLSDVSVSEWNLLDMYSSIAYEKEQLKAVEERRKEQEAFKKHLSATQMQLEEQRLAEKHDIETYVKEQSRLAYIWQRQQEKARQKKLEVALEEKRVREQQIAKKRETLGREAAQRRAEELDEIRRCKEQLELARQEAVRKRQEEHRRLMAILEDNKQENARRLVAKAKEAEEDARLMAEYRAKLEREDEERRQAFAKRMERYEAYGRLWADQGAGKKQQEERIRQEKLILREAKKKEDADVERERRDKEYLRQTARDIATTNKALAEEGRRRLKQEHDDDMKYAVVFRQEGESFLQKQRELAAERLEAEKKHAAFIREQIESDRRRRQAVEMSDAERSINREILGKIKADEEMMHKIVEKFHYTPSEAPKVARGRETERKRAREAERKGEAWVEALRDVMKKMDEGKQKGNPGDQRHVLLYSCQKQAATCLAFNGQATGSPSEKLRGCPQASKKFYVALNLPKETALAPPPWADWTRTQSPRCACRRPLPPKTPPPSDSRGRRIPRPRRPRLHSTALRAE
eukprot:scaffold1130_cov195-Pinguiococcus_pyrenoidosus.AAC.91